MTMEERFAAAKEAIESATTVHELSAARDKWLSGPEWDHMLPKYADELAELFRKRRNHFLGVFSG